MLTILVRLILFPLTAKQAKSMIAMQRAQPEIKKLQAKYKNDKQKLNEEMMKFYKENQINPLGGCLPLLAQMPIFIALYQTLREHPALHPARLVDVLRDICTPDTTCKVVNLDFFGMNLTQSAGRPPKGFGNALPYFVLVGLVVITAFLQQRQTMRNQTQANPQMQIIGKVMPVIFGFISINIPAGVVLYFFTSNLWQIGQQEVVFRTIGTAAGPPARRATRAGARVPTRAAEAAPAIEAKSTETPAAVDGRGEGSVQEPGAGIGHAGGRRAERRTASRNQRTRDRGQGLRLHPEEAEDPTEAATKKPKSPPATPKQPDAGSGNGSPAGGSTSRAAPEQPKAEAIDGVGGDNRPDGRGSARLGARRARGARGRRRGRGPRGARAGLFGRFGGSEARVRVRLKPISREKPGDRRRRKTQGPAPGRRQRSGRRPGRAAVGDQVGEGPADAGGGRGRGGSGSRESAERRRCGSDRSPAESEVRRGPRAGGGGDGRRGRSGEGAAKGNDMEEIDGAGRATGRDGGGVHRRAGGGVRRGGAG